ncbi:hypothetical protein COCOBI_07-4960 [Coccomyxa sp. Obi]|nr:hypothetical protein COCOBI_07-4960 [Coccomyxa sp. Obi]
MYNALRNLGRANSAPFSFLSKLQELLEKPDGIEMGESEQERPLAASPSKLRVDAPSFSPVGAKKAIPPVQTNFPKLYHKLDAVPFTPSQGVLSPTPSNMATLWYQHQHTYMESPNYHQHYPHTPMYPVPLSPAAWPQVVQRSVSLGAMPQWPPTMQSAPVSPAIAFTPSQMSQGWQMQPHPAAFQWPQSPHPTGPSGNGFGGYPQSPHPSTMHHVMAPPGPPAGSYVLPMQPPPPPVYVPVMSRPATSPAPLGILLHSPEHSDRGSQSTSPTSRQAGSSSRAMNLAFLSALHHNHRAIGNAMQQLAAAEPGVPEQLQAAVQGIGDTADRIHREPTSFDVLGQSPQRSGGRVPILNARARRTLKRALKRAVAELSAAGVNLTNTLRPLPYSGGDALADGNNGPHDAESLTGAENSKSSLGCGESSGSVSPTAKTTRQPSPHLCEKCGTQSMAVTAAVASHDSPLDGSAGSELSDSNSDRPPEENATADGANARDGRMHGESEAGALKALSGKPGRREMQQPKIRITVNAARRLPKPIMLDSEGEELHREGEWGADKLVPGK